MKNVNVKELEQLKEGLQKAELDLFVESCAKELAARLLRKVVKRTPVGEYPKSTGKLGGTLRRNWTDGKTVSSYVNGVPIVRMGKNYIITMVNPTKYASYVEFGHRKRNRKGWVKGQFMLTISEGEIERSAPAILEKKIKKKLGEILDGK